MCIRDRVALDTLALQVQLGFGGDDSLDIVSLGQGVHVHVVIDHQQAAFQIGTGKAVVLAFLDAAVAGGISHEPLEDVYKRQPVRSVRRTEIQNTNDNSS